MSRVVFELFACYHDSRVKQPTLYLMLGYPGAGKSTTAQAIHNVTGATHVWADKERNQRYPNPTHSHKENLELYAYLNQRTDDLLAGGDSVIFDTGFNFLKDREHLRSIATKHDATVVLIWVKTEREIAYDRATQASHAARNTYPLPMQPDRFERISNDFEPPTIDEPYLALDGTKITDQYVAKQLSVTKHPESA